MCNNLGRLAQFGDTVFKKQVDESRLTTHLAL